MLCFNLRWIATLMAALFLSNCGFEPALKKETLSPPLNGNFEVSVQGDFAAFTLQELLTQRLGSNVGLPDYLLTADLTMGVRNESVLGAGGINRKSIKGSINYTIKSKNHDGNLTSGIVAGEASYSEGADFVASESARRAAEMKMLKQIVDRLYSRLILTADR